MSIEDLKEYVLVFPSNLLRNLGYFQGLRLDFEKYLEAIGPNSHFKKRGDVENDINYKQVILYVVIFHHDRILNYRRGPGLAESRLSHKRSIGIGGHVTTADKISSDGMYSACMKREIDEEIYLDTEYKDKVVAVLNDDSNDVGRVHFGILTTLRLEHPYVRKKETSIIECQFAAVDELERNLEEFERWSQIVIDNIERLL